MAFRYETPVVYMLIITLVMGVLLSTAYSQGSISRASQVGRGVIQQFEGLRLCHYKDAAGLWTVGYGHLLKNQSLGRSNKCLTGRQVEALFDSDIRNFESCVSLYVGTLGENMSQFRFDALVSFSFNVGCGALQKSTLLKRHKAGSFEQASKQFTRWVNAGGRFLRGLWLRRKLEAMLYMS